VHIKLWPIPTAKIRLRKSPVTAAKRLSQCWPIVGADCPGVDVPQNQQQQLSTPPGGSLIRAWDGATPIMMSLAVLVMVAIDCLRHGLHAPHHDEDGMDHLAMLLMFGQIPIMIWFTAPRRHRFRQVLPILALQLLMWIVAFVSAVKLT
jgi:hypothetical protein